MTHVLIVRHYSGETREVPADVGYALLRTGHYELVGERVLVETAMLDAGETAMLAAPAAKRRGRPRGRKAVSERG